MRRALTPRLGTMAGKGSLTPFSKTLFVRNLPYTTRDDGLEAVFSEYGPLKSCFTVKEKGTVAQCRGFGYVIFAVRGDAERAKRCVKLVGGRPVQVMFAKRRPPGAKAEKKGSDDRGEKEGGEVARSSVGGEEGEEVANGYRSSGGDSSTEEEAEENDYETRTAKGTAKKQRKPKSQRGSPKFDIGRTVVLKNLPETTTGKKLSKKCQKFGTVESVTFPVPNRKIPTAFVTFESFKEARTAEFGLNGASYRGKSLDAVLLSRENKAVSKRTLRKSRLIVRNLSFKCSEDGLKDAFSPFGDVVEVHLPKKKDGTMLGYAFVQFRSFFSAAKALAEVNTKVICGRPVAVDWVVPRDQYKQSLEHHSEEEGDTSLNNEEALSASGETDSGSDSQEKADRRESEEITKEESAEDDDSEKEDSVEESEESESDVESEEEKQPQKKKKSVQEDVHEGKTLFIRNIPFDADDGELKDVFVKFGGVRYCRLVRNPITKFCKGSAFVQFYEPESVQRCLQTVTSEHGQGIQYGGRHLDVVMAITKGDVDKLKEEKAGKEVVDRRNLYLAKEGVIPQGSEAARDISKSDLNKRMRAQSEKKTKLANPNFFVSKTRLSIRNIPTQVDEKQLKTLFLEAAGGSSARITQAKLLRSQERVTSKGTGRSKGYAFVEFSTHEAALRALRSTNNNPDLFGTNKRLIVEFAVEDSRALKVREQRKQKQLSLKKTTPTSELLGPSDSTQSTTDRRKVLSKRTEWNLKWKERRLQRKEKGSKGPSPETREGRTASVKSGVARMSKKDVGEKTERAITRGGVLRGQKERRNGGRETSTRRGIKRKLGHGHDQELGGTSAKRTRIGSDISKMSRSFPEQKTIARNADSSDRRVRSRKKKQKREVKEEREFAGMIDKYKRKLFGSASDSRWFE